MTSKSSAPHPDELLTIEQVLAHLEQLEAQLREVRQGLTHSHRLATLGTISSIIAHEYNNILTPVVSYAQMALARPEDHELTHKALAKALAGAERAARISAALLGFARQADDQQVAHLPRTVQEALSCLARDPRKDGIELTVDLPDVRVAMSPLQLEQVLVNLILNARQAFKSQAAGAEPSSPGSLRKLRISAQVAAELVHLEVSDNGPGIPESIRARLFEPFVTFQRPAPAGPAVGTPGAASGAAPAADRGPEIRKPRGGGDEAGDESGAAAGAQRSGVGTSQSAGGGSGGSGGGHSGSGGGGGGTGLGLSICRDLIHQAGGAIRVESREGQGATFHITLPRADDLFAAA